MTMAHFQGFIKEVCQPDLVQHLICVEVCKAAQDDPECVGRCVEGTKLIHLFRERFCHLVTGTGAPTSSDCPETCLLAKTFVHFQSGIILTYSGRAGYAAWCTSKTWAEFMKGAAVPVLGITLGLSGLAVAAVV
jgi:hypothetical protein